jgi:hypothetical protein
MRKPIRFFSVAITLSVVAASSVALAGLNASTGSVYVLANTYASGPVAGARYSSDSAEYIGCEVSTAPGGTPWLWCFANNSSGTYLGCTSQDVALVATARAVNETSEIAFDASNGTCTYLWVTNASYFMH